ncbi:hypothetical protein [Rhodoferax sp.]|uniref:hypothetical protein n=1 Tax=Rhodoferax sp. TaxID=50421 RepID=UPI00271B0B2D|nr:hypothetical protein [Rhodoferax sp.]MDO9195661.1 hypothetical protein [Rhodoferax sp.]
MFENSGRYAARLATGKLQIVAETPRDAFDAMRNCVRQYLRKYGCDALGIIHTTHPKEAQLQPDDQRAYTEYRMLLATVKTHNGFWKGTSMANMIASKHKNVRHVRNAFSMGWRVASTVLLTTAFMGVPFSSGCGLLIRYITLD